MNTHSQREEFPFISAVLYCDDFAFWWLNILKSVEHVFHILENWSWIYGYD